MDALTPSQMNEKYRRIWSEANGKRLALLALKNAPKFLKSRGDAAKAAKPRKKRR